MPATVAPPLVKATRSWGAWLGSAARTMERGCGASSEETVDVLAAKARNMATANLKMSRPELESPVQANHPPIS